MYLTHTNTCSHCTHSPSHSPRLDTNSPKPRGSAQKVFRYVKNSLEFVISNDSRYSFKFLNAGAFSVDFKPNVALQFVMTGSLEAEGWKEATGSWKQTLTLTSTELTELNMTWLDVTWKFMVEKNSKTTNNNFNSWTEQPSLAGSNSTVQLANASKKKMPHGLTWHDKSTFGLNMNWAKLPLPLPPSLSASAGAGKEEACENMASFSL